MGALAHRQRAAAIGMLAHLMQDVLQQIDLDFYRSMRLLIARAELEHLRLGRSPLADVERRSKRSSEGQSSSTESSGYRCQSIDDLTERERAATEG